MTNRMSRTFSEFFHAASVLTALVAAVLLAAGKDYITAAAWAGVAFLAFRGRYTPSIASAPYLFVMLAAGCLWSTVSTFLAGEMMAAAQVGAMFVHCVFMVLREIWPTSSIPLVIIESPFAGDTEKNLRYVRAAMRDCLTRGEAPFASHALYTQDGVLDDNDPKERATGIDAGLLWGEYADKTVVYTDLGVSSGMLYGIKLAERAGRPIERRTLPGWQQPDSAPTPTS